MEEKSYLVEMTMELLTDDNGKVKAINIHRTKHEQIPLHLWCDFIGKIAHMVPGENVMFVDDGLSIKPLVEKDKAYIIKKDIGDFIRGDIFKGVGDRELVHCRSERVVKVTRDDIKDFTCVGDYDDEMAKPIPTEMEEVIERMKRQLTGK